MSELASNMLGWLVKRCWNSYGFVHLFESGKLWNEQAVSSYRPLLKSLYRKNVTIMMVLEIMWSPNKWLVRLFSIKDAIFFIFSRMHQFLFSLYLIFNNLTTLTFLIVLEIYSKSPIMRLLCILLNVVLWIFHLSPLNST